jgi:hypothetical protein
VSSYQAVTIDLGKKVRDHISALEARVIESMLQRPAGAGLSTPPSSTNQYSAFTPSTGSSNVQPYQSPEQILDFPLDFSEAMDQTYAAQSAATSPSQSSPQSEYPTPPHGSYDGHPTPAASCASMCSRCASCSDSHSSSTSRDMGEAFYQPPVESSSQSNQLSHSVPFPEAPVYAESGANPREVFIIDPRQAPTPRSQLPITPPYSHSEETLSLHHYTPHGQYHPSHQQPTWRTGVSPPPRVIAMPAAASCMYSIVSHHTPEIFTLHRSPFS